MPRVDICDAGPAALGPLSCGFDDTLHDVYNVHEQEVIGKGGFGVVRTCSHRLSGEVFACKAIAKRLALPGVSKAKQQLHLENIKREVAVLQVLTRKLPVSVARLESVHEDELNVYMVLQRCTGGELWKPRGQRVTSELTVRRWMLSVFRTIHQCHAHGVLHRDIKPGNFLLLDESPDAPVKAIDFGMAVFFRPQELPMTELGLDGTAWFMAPEVLSSEVYPASDVWAAGVMAYQLLSGYMPFDDKANPNEPELSKVWKSILRDEPAFRRPCWASISDQAKEFIKATLQKDCHKRISAAHAIVHPWLKEASAHNAAPTQPLDGQIITRIQHFANRDPVQRTILPLIANELLHRLQQSPSPSDESPHPSVHASRQLSDALLRSLPELPLHRAAQTGSMDIGTARSEGCLATAMAGAAEGAPAEGAPAEEAEGQAGAQAGPPLGLVPRLAAMQSKEELSLTTAAILEGSVRGRFRAKRELSRQRWQAEEQRRAARLALGATWRTHHGGTLFASAQDSSTSRGHATSSSGAHSVYSISSTRSPARGPSGHGAAEPRGTAPDESPDKAAQHAELRAEFLDFEPAPRARALPGINTRVAGNAELPIVSEGDEGGSVSSAEGKMRNGRFFGGPDGLDRSGSGRSGRNYNRGSQDWSGWQPGQHPPQDGSGRRSPGYDGSNPGSPFKTLPSGEQMYRASSHDGSGHGSLRDLSRGGSWDGSPSLDGSFGRTAVLRGDGSGRAPASPNSNPSSPHKELGRNQGSIHRAGRLPRERDLAEKVAQVSGGPAQASTGDATVQSARSKRLMQDASRHDRGLYSFLCKFMDSDAKLEEMRALLQKLNLRGSNASVSRAEFQRALQQDLGYKLTDSEAHALLKYVSSVDQVSQAQFVAAQLDWSALQHTELWMECARATFEDMDKDQDGRIATSDLLEAVRTKLSADQAELDMALEEEMMAAIAESCSMTFEDYVQRLQSVPGLALDAFDSRFQPRPKSSRDGAAS